METEYAISYRDLYENHWWWRSRERIIEDLLERLAPDTGWPAILDVGCGDGLLFPLLSRWGPVEGVEPHPEVMSGRLASDGTIYPVPFDSRFTSDRRYGLILMLDVLEHLDRPEEALGKAAELLLPGGCLIITVPAYELIWTRHDDLNEHRRRYVKPRLRSLVAGSGFTIEEMSYLFQALFFLKLLTRGLEAIWSGDPRIPQIPPRPINRALEAFCYWERRALAPLHPPVGSSLLCVARPGGPLAAAGW